MPPGAPPLSAAVMLGLGLAPGDPAARALRILVADPHGGRRAQMLGALAAAGQQALAATGWAEVTGLLGREPVDAAVIAALDLPGAGGLEAARRLRAWPAPVAALPLLLLDTGAVPLREEAWRGAGFDALLPWPAGLEDLAARIRAEVVRLTPPPPLDPARRAALLAAMGAEALAAADAAALARAAALCRTLVAAREAEVGRTVAETLAALCEGIGALPAAAAARDLTASERFPPPMAGLMGALAAASAAIRFAGRQGAVPIRRR